MEYFEGGELFYKIKNSYESSSITEQGVVRIMFHICSTVKNFRFIGIPQIKTKKYIVLTP